VLLSAAASASDMVTEEIKRARDRHRTHGSPVIIPLRVRYEAIQGTLSALCSGRFSGRAGKATTIRRASCRQSCMSPHIHLHNFRPHNLQLMQLALRCLARHYHVLRQWLRLCLAAPCYRMILFTCLDPTMRTC
jgi:hypothetical protein